MTPKKAIVILLILSLAIGVAFVFLYVNSKSAPAKLINQPADSNANSNLTEQIKLTPEQQKIKEIEDRAKEQIKKIFEQGRTATGGVTPEAQKKIDEAVNQEIMEKLKLRTPEQIEADEQRQIDQEKLDQQTNSQMQNK